MIDIIIGVLLVIIIIAGAVTAIVMTSNKNNNKDKKDNKSKGKKQEEDEEEEDEGGDVDNSAQSYSPPTATQYQSASQNITSTSTTSLSTTSSVSATATSTANITSSNNTGGNYYTIENMDYFPYFHNNNQGHVVSRVTNLSQCKQACDDSPSCIGFVHYSNAAQCRTLHVTYANKSKVRIITGKDSNGQAVWSTYDNARFADPILPAHLTSTSNNDYVNSNQVTEKLCLTSCANQNQGTLDSYCGGYSHYDTFIGDTPYRLCRLLNKATVNSNMDDRVSTHLKVLSNATGTTSLTSTV